MDVTKYNFEEEFSNIKKDIEESAFLAIDGEFTGLSREGQGRLCPFDTPSDRYRKLRDGASDFLLIQFGLCAFKVNELEKKYEARPYNFYIFPRPQDQRSVDRRFLCQSSSIDFLISHDFDFNKVFKEGIPYVTHEQEMKLRADLERRQADRNNSSFNSKLQSPDATPNNKRSFVFPPEYKDFLAHIGGKIDAYLKSEETEPLNLPPCNAFQRKLIFKLAEQDYPTSHLESKTGAKKERFIVVSKFKDEKEAEEREKTRQDMEMMTLDIQVGFTKVMRLITESGKPVVGHNMYLDIIHSLNHFYGPIPQELDDFKEMLSTVFPRVVDTKLISNTNPFKEYLLDTSLEALSAALKAPPFKAAQVEIPERFSKYTGDAGIYHEAGYDAFVTGSCFASLINFLGRYQTPASNFLLPSHSAVEAFANKLYAFRMDMQYLNLAGPDMVPDRDHVFHVTFPEEWRADDLHQLFEPFGNIQISWLTNRTAYVGLYKKENAKLALTSLTKGVSSFQVVSYHAHRQMMQMKCHISPISALPTTTLMQPSKFGATTTGTKRSIAVIDGASPPSKLPRATPNTGAQDMEENLGGDKKMKEKEGEEVEEDLGVAVSNEEIKEKLSKGNDEPETNSGVSQKDNKLFEEPDAW